MISTRHGKYVNSWGTIAGACESVASHNYTIMQNELVILVMKIAIENSLSLAPFLSI